MTFNEEKAAHFAEFRVLTATYQDPDIIDEKGLSEDMFSSTTSKSIFRQLEYLYRNKFDINEHSLQEALLKEGITDSLFAKGISDAERESNIDDALKDISNHNREIRLKNAVQELVDEVNKESGRSIDRVRDLAAKAEEATLDDDQKKRSLTMKEWGEKHEEEFSKRRNGKLYPFYDDILDDLIPEGAAPGSGTLLVAASGMGKSAYALHILNQRINLNAPTGYFSFEMGLVSSYDRLLSKRLEKPFIKFVNIKDEAEWQELNKEVTAERQKLDNVKNFFISEDPLLSINDIKTEIRKFQAKIGQRYCVIIFDLMTMIKEFSDGDNMAQKIEVATNKLNAISKELGFHYIGLAQVGRSAEDTKITDIDDIERCRPTRNSVKNSNAMLERTRGTVYLFRPRFYADAYLTKEEAESIDDVIEIGLLKLNNGKIKRHHVLYIGDHFGIEPIANEEDYE